MCALGFRPALVPRGASRLQAAGLGRSWAGRSWAISLPKTSLRQHPAAEPQRVAPAPPPPLPPLQDGRLLLDVSASSPTYSYPESIPRLRNVNSPLETRLGNLVFAGVWAAIACFMPFPVLPVLLALYFFYLSCSDSPL